MREAHNKDDVIGSLHISNHGSPFACPHVLLVIGLTYIPELRPWASRGEKGRAVWQRYLVVPSPSVITGHSYESWVRSPNYQTSCLGTWYASFTTLG